MFSSSVFFFFVIYYFSEEFSLKTNHLHVGILKPVVCVFVEIVSRLALQVHSSAVKIFVVTFF